MLTNNIGRIPGETDDQLKHRYRLTAEGIDFRYTANESNDMETRSKKEFIDYLKRELDRQTKTTDGYKKTLKGLERELADLLKQQQKNSETYVEKFIQKNSR